MARDLKSQAYVLAIVSVCNCMWVFVMWVYAAALCLGDRRRRIHHPSHCHLVISRALLRAHQVVALCSVHVLAALPGALRSASRPHTRCRREEHGSIDSTELPRSSLSCVRPKSKHLRRVLPPVRCLRASRANRKNLLDCRLLDCRPEGSPLV